MKIINPNVLSDISKGKAISLNLGGGLQRVEGHYNVDLVELPNVDIVANLNEALDLLAENSVSGVYSNNTFEHVTNLFGLLSEIHRICRNGAYCEIIVPHFANPYYYSDPTHVRQFGLFTMHYFVDSDQQWRRKVPSYYSNTRFKLINVELLFYRDSWFDQIAAPLAYWVVNLSRFTQHLFERRFCWIWPPAHVKYVIRIEK